MLNLESLPNEILLDLFQNYVNSIDLFVGFAQRLNARFTALVRQCRGFQLDLRQIRKRDFQQCVTSTEIFRERIESLLIGEDLPGQMKAFFDIFPTLDRFQSLGELNLSFKEPPINQPGLLSALNSISLTRIHTLSIHFAHSNHNDLLAGIYQKIFSLPTLRRLVLDIDYLKDIEQAFDPPPCHLESLTLRGYGLLWNDLSKILTCANQLSYLNIELTYPRWRYVSIDDIDWDFQPLTQLRTLYFHWHHLDAPIDSWILAKFCTKMPNLNRLTVTGPNEEYIDDAIWEMVTASLPALTHLTWRICEQTQSDSFFREQAFKSMQRLTSIHEKTFQVYKVIPYHDHSTKQNSFYYSPIVSSSNVSWNLKASSWWLPSRQCLSKITALYMTDAFPIPMIEYKLNHVKCFRIDSINSSLYQWINTWINLNNILQLDISSVKTDWHFFRLLISSMKNLRRLSIDFNVLVNNSSIETNHSMKELNISSIEHSFLEQNIHFLTNLFPSIEHLSIHTKDLHHVPLLRNYLPNLITLTFQIIDPDYRYSRKKSKWIRRFGTKVSFAYQYIEDTITVWIDDDVFNDSFWRSTLHYHHEFSLRRIFRHLANKLNDS